jgi:hypothetical protein
MRILCDQHVDHKYVHALQQADGITVTTVRHVMHAHAPDSDIASYAAANDWLDPLTAIEIGALPESERSSIAADADIDISQFEVLQIGRGPLNSQSSNLSEFI